MTDYKDAKAVYAKTVEEMLGEYGITERATPAEVKTTIAECTAEYDMCWAELMQWVEYGDDEREKTMNVIRTALKVARMW